MSYRNDIEAELNIKKSINDANTELQTTIEKVQQQKLTRDVTTLGQAAGDVQAGFKSLTNAVTGKGEFESKGTALNETTENIKGIGDKFDRAATEVNHSAKTVSTLFGDSSEEGSIMNAISSNDSAALLDALSGSSAVEAVGGDVAGKIASIISLLTGLGAMLDGLNAQGIGGSGLDALGKTGETMAGKADGLMGTLNNAAGSLEGISNASNLTELTGQVQNFANDITSVATEVSGLKNSLTVDGVVKDFTGNLQTDDGGNLTELGKAYNDVSGTIKDVDKEIKGIKNTYDQTVGEIQGGISTVQGEVQKAKNFVGDVTTGGGILQDLSENRTGQAGNKVDQLTGAINLTNTPLSIKPSGQNSLSTANKSQVISKAQSGNPVQFAQACQTVAENQVAIDKDIKKILSKQKGFGNTRELVENVKNEAKTQGIKKELIDDFEKVFGVVEVGMGQVDTTVHNQLKKTKDGIYDETFSIDAYPQEFETFAKFETGIISSTNNPDNLKKPVVFQTCDSKEELLTEMRQFKRDIKTVIVHSTESFKNQNLTAEMLNTEHKDNGFDHIQYHFVIRRDGTIQRGIPTTLSSKLDPKEFRDNSINIALVGGIDAPTGTEAPNSFRSGSSFSRAQFTTLDMFFDLYYKLFPGGKVYGHGELVEGYNDPYFDVKGYVLRKFRKTR